MLNIFKKNNTEFSYLKAGEIYLDSACQTVRPQSVINAERDYYHNYNACSDRAKHQWGNKVTNEVHQARENLLKLCGKSSKNYNVFFTANTTTAINLVLQQLKFQKYNCIVTTDIEHNSVFLPSITVARLHGLKRVVLPRFNHQIDLGNYNSSIGKNDCPIFIANCLSNLDGQRLENIAEITTQIHQQGGLVLLDGAQALGHHTRWLHDIDFDGLFSSGHKMYGPSLGFGIIKKI